MRDELRQKNSEHLTINNDVVTGTLDTIFHCKVYFKFEILKTLDLAGDFHRI